VKRKSHPPTKNDLGHEGPSNIRHYSSLSCAGISSSREVNKNELLYYDLTDRKRLSEYIGTKLQDGIRWKLFEDP
jgi:hypothetical protein